MKKFVVSWNELVTLAVEVEAEDEQQALELVKEGDFDKEEVEECGTDIDFSSFEVEQSDLS